MDTKRYFERPRYIDAMERRMRNVTATVERAHQELDNCGVSGAGLNDLSVAVAGLLRSAARFDKEIHRRKYYRGS